MIALQPIARQHNGARRFSAGAVECDEFGLRLLRAEGSATVTRHHSASWAAAILLVYDPVTRNVAVRD